MMKRREEFPDKKEIKEPLHPQQPEEIQTGRLPSEVEPATNRNESEHVTGLIPDQEQGSEFIGEESMPSRNMGAEPFPLKDDQM